MITRKNLQRTLTILLFTLLGLGVSAGGYTYFDDYLEKSGWAIYDIFQNLTVREKAPGIALILVDQASIDSLAKDDGFVFPWPRQFFGIVATVAKEAGAQGVAYDILFTEPSSHGVEDDQNFASLLEESKLPIFMPAASKKLTVKDPTDRIKNFVTKLFLGGVNVSNEEDGVFRRLPALLPGKNQPIVSLAGSIYQKLYSQDLHQKEWLRFYKEEGFSFISFYEVIRAYRALQEGKPLPGNIKELKNLVWMVGYTAPGLHDLKPIPTDAEAPGLIVQATGLANRIEKIGIKQATVLQIFFILSLICLLSVLTANLARTPSPAVIGFLSISILGSFSASYLFWEYDVWLNTLPLIFGGLVSGGTQLTWNFHMHWKDRLRLAESLEHSMSSDMVELIRCGDIQISRFGEKREITIFFCDLAGFTTLSEQLSAAKLVEILNKYLDGVVNHLVDHKGYVDKFIGDAVMAFWGAPIEQSNHAQLGLKAAVDFQQVIDNFNQEVERQFGDVATLSARIGLHTGPVIVGNVGAQYRYNYTAIGDSVNLSARLESLGKQYDCKLLMSEDTVKAAQALGTPGLIEVDLVKVKGRSAATRIYSFVPPEYKKDIDNYKQGMQNYYEAKWSQALELFNAATNVPCSKIIGARCQQAISHGTPPNWQQGAWAHDSK